MLNKHDLIFLCLLHLKASLWTIRRPLTTYHFFLYVNCYINFSKKKKGWVCNTMTAEGLSTLDLIIHIFLFFLTLKWHFLINHHRRPLGNSASRTAKLSLMKLSSDTTKWQGLKQQIWFCIRHFVHLAGLHGQVPTVGTARWHWAMNPPSVQHEPSGECVLQVFSGEQHLLALWCQPPLHTVFPWCLVAGRKNQKEENKVKVAAFLELCKT